MSGRKINYVSETRISKDMYVDVAVHLKTVHGPKYGDIYSFFYEDMLMVYAIYNGKDFYFCFFEIL